MTPWFIAVEKFGPADGNSWTKYVEWSGLKQLDELISLDAVLCPPLLQDIKADHWPHIVHDNGCLDFFTDLAFLRGEVAGLEGARILCVYRNPKFPPVLPVELSSFKLAGYDLVEIGGGPSALTNCGGWPGILDNSELSAKGLLENHARALQLQELLARQYPEEPHANCDLWAIFV